MIINIFTPNNRAKKYTKKKWTVLKGRIGNPTTIIGNLNTPFSTIDRTTKEKNQ